MAAALGLAAGGGPAAADDRPPAGAGIFGSFEFRTAPLRPIGKWTRVVAAMRDERAAFIRCAADESRCTTPALRSWRMLAVAVAGRNDRYRLDAVNRFFNQWRHVDDREAHGVREHWSSPSEFMAASGDCEDYAIAKLFALRLLGFEEGDLRIVTVTDRTRGAEHAVLAVYLADDILVLDNVTDRIVSHRALRHYVPRYSLSETASWAHIPRRGRRRGAAPSGSPSGTLGSIHQD